MSPVSTAAPTRTLVVDADSHVLEPADLWTTYLEPRYRDRAIRIEVRDGVEHLLMGEQVIMSGTLAGLGGAHLDRKSLFAPGMRYSDGCPPASYDPAARLALFDEWQVDAGVVFPTIGILPFPCEDQDLISAYRRAYNTWQAEFTADAGGQVLPIAHLNLEDLDEAVRELDRCLALGFRGVFLPPELVGGRRPSDPYFDPLWRRCAEADVPVCVHVVVRFGGSGLPFEPWLLSGAGMTFGFSLTAVGQLMPTVSAMVLDGLFDRVPDLKVVCVEAGCGWAAHLMDRLDEKYDTVGTLFPALSHRPSDYLRRNVYFVAEPGERTIGAMLDLVGEDRILWGSDFPHIDSTMQAPEQIRASVAGLSPEQQAAVLGGNAMKVFGV